MERKQNKRFYTIFEKITAKKILYQNLNFIFIFDNIIFYLFFLGLSVLFFFKLTCFFMSIKSCTTFPSFFCRSLKLLFFQFPFLNLQGLFLMYFPFISFKALTKSLGSKKLTNPYPFDFIVLLFFINLHFAKDGYFPNASLRSSSVVSFPRSPTKIL